MSRSSLVVIAGTGTEVGKTWFATRLLALARADGIATAARKPAQSFAPTESTPTDAELLAQASGEEVHSVCPAHRWYPAAMAPPMAADVLGRPKIQLSDLIGETRWSTAAELRILETAGGLLSPIAHDADNLQLIRRLAPQHVILVADAGLGTLNAVRLCASVLDDVRLTIFLNRYQAEDELHRLNYAWLTRKYELPATTSVEDCLRAVSSR